MITEYCFEEQYFNLHLKVTQFYAHFIGFQFKLHNKNVFFKLFSYLGINPFNTKTITTSWNMKG